ncbi:MAG: hypothetical protein NZM27_03490, partial [Acetobacteraceae bacterium]|nr:hypothetical protein [Acetobacteraceae bacterium]
MLRTGRPRFDAGILAAFPVQRIGVEVPGLERPVAIRLGGTGRQVFRETFFRDDSSFVPPPGLRAIVDAGANVGCSVLWFRRQSPEPRIAALEPDPYNFAVLAAGCGRLPGVTRLQAALWGTDGEVRIERRRSAGRPLGSWGTRTAAPGAAPA